MNDTDAPYSPSAAGPLKRKLLPKDSKTAVRAKKNRESAQASRDRQKLYVVELESKNERMGERIAHLEELNTALGVKLDAILALLGKERSAVLSPLLPSPVSPSESALSQFLNLPVAAASPSVSAVSVPEERNPLDDLFASDLESFAQHTPTSPFEASRDHSERFDAMFNVDQLSVPLLYQTLPALPSSSNAPAVKDAYNPFTRFGLQPQSSQYSASPIPSLPGQFPLKTDPTAISSAHPRSGGWPFTTLQQLSALTCPPLDSPRLQHFGNPLISLIQGIPQICLKVRAWRMEDGLAGVGALEEGLVGLKELSSRSKEGESKSQFEDMFPISFEILKRM